MSNPLPIPLKVMSGWRTKQRPAHEGIDLTAPVGTPVLSIRDGFVKLVTGDTGPAGNSIIVQHSADDETRYNHLRHRPHFNIGEPIKAGQRIGVVGMTGRTDAPHLHFARYRLRGFRWRDVDPTSVLDFSVAAGGGSTPFTPTTEEDDMPVIVYEGPDSRAGKKLGDIRTGKAIRTLTAAEGHALRDAQASGAAVFVPLSKAEFDKL